MLWVGDCLAASAFISPEFFARHAAPSAKKAIRALKETGVFLIYHASEYSPAHIKLEAELSADALNLSEKVDISKMREIVGDNQCLMGNLDPIRLLMNGSVEDVRGETAEMMERNKGAGGPYIFGTSEGITQNASRENVKAMMDEARRHAAYS